MITIYITFGTDHNDKHPVLGIPYPLRLSEGYIAIEGATRSIALRIAQGLLGTTYAFDYLEPPKPQYAPQGELFRLAWIDPARRSTLTEAINDTYRAADEDSNDKEIELLQRTRDLLEGFVEGQGR